MQTLREDLLERLHLWDWRWCLLDGLLETSIGIRTHTVEATSYKCHLIHFEGWNISDAPLESLSYEQLKERLAFLKQLEEQQNKK